MSAANEPRDLIVLVADRNMRAALSGILNRPESLKIRQPTFVVRVHSRRDPGVLHQAHAFLRAFAGKYKHAMVVFDREGCGKEEVDRAGLEAEVESRLARNGWPDTAATIVLDPELESWVWSDSREVDQCLGWREQPEGLRVWLVQQGLLDVRQSKPARPKEAMEAVLRRVKHARSSAVYKNLAQRVGFARCTDPAFVKLKQTLRRWFPQP